MKFCENLIEIDRNLMRSGQNSVRIWWKYRNISHFQRINLNPTTPFSCMSFCINLEYPNVRIKWLVFPPCREGKQVILCEHSPFPWNFGRLVLGCINTDFNEFCEILSSFARSTIIPPQNNALCTFSARNKNFQKARHFGMPRMTRVSQVPLLTSRKACRTFFN